jgi:hypothetical protein
MAWYLVKHRDNFTFTFTFIEKKSHRIFVRKKRNISGNKEGQRLILHDFAKIN